MTPVRGWRLRERAAVARGHDKYALAPLRDAETRRIEMNDRRRVRCPAPLVDSGKRVVE